MGQATKVTLSTSTHLLTYFVKNERFIPSVKKTAQKSREKKTSVKVRIMQKGIAEQKGIFWIFLRFKPNDSATIKPFRVVM